MQRLEKSRWAFKDKESTIYSKHTPVPVWVVLKSKDNSVFVNTVHALLEAQAKYMPWHGLFVMDAVNYLREEGYSHRLPAAGDIMELSESVSLLLLQEVMIHFNEVCRVSDDPIKSYNGIDLVVKEAYDYARILDYLVSCQDDITLSCMFDTQRSNTKVYFTVMHDVSADFVETLRRMSPNLLLVTDEPKGNLNFDDTILVSEGADTILEKISKRF
jgi:hypothetical protein